MRKLKYTVAEGLAWSPHGADRGVGVAVHQPNPELWGVAVTMFHGVLMGLICRGSFSKQFFSLIDGTRERLSGQNHSNCNVHKIGLWSICIMAISEAPPQANSVLFEMFHKYPLMFIRRSRYWCLEKMNSLFKVTERKDKGKMYPQMENSGNQVGKAHWASVQLI